MFNGWVVDITPSQVILNLKTTDLLPEDTIMLEVFGPQTNLLISLRFEVAFNGNFIFAVLNEAKIMPTAEEARFSVGNFAAEVRAKDCEVAAKVVDVSESGMGLKSPQQFSRGEMLNLLVSLPKGEIEVAGEVRYCSKPHVDGTCRVGVLISTEGRLAAARWKSLINDYLAAA